MLKVSLISLGCAKNLVDSEIMVGHLHQAGMQVIPDAEKADVVIVNTCSFIDSSKEESIAHILEVNQNRGMRKRNKSQKLIVAGCMSQRFSKDLSGGLPEVDAFIGLDQITKVAPIIEGLFAKEREAQGVPLDLVTPALHLHPRLQHAAVPADPEAFRVHQDRGRLQPPLHLLHHPADPWPAPQPHRGQRRLRGHAAGEGRRPRDRPDFPGHDLLRHGHLGAAPESPHPGRFLRAAHALTTLLRRLNAIEGDFWIRLLYTHPAHWSDELIQTIAECPKVARYIDIPLQHISDRMLKIMQRETSGDYIRDLIRRIRAGIPGIAVRTTFIVGFPGETEADVDELCEFVKETRFERLGVFRYSQEEGTRAAKMDEQVPAKVKEARWHRVMKLQQEIAASVSASRVGTTQRVLVEEPGVARGEADAPDIDGRVYVPRELPVGEFADVAITSFTRVRPLALPPGRSPEELETRQAGAVDRSG